MNLAAFSNIGALIAADADAARWLTPHEPTAAARAAAGAEAAELVGTLLTTLIRAGICGTPSDALSRRILDLEAQVRSETDALRAWVGMPGADDE